MASAEFLFKHRILRILRIFSLFHSMAILSDDCAAAEVELRRERYAVHFLFGFVLEGDFLFGYDGAGEELAVDVYPCVFRH